MTDKPDFVSHRPLPYIVTLRMAASDDGLTERFEKRVMGYTLYEAMFAAIVEATGSSSLEQAKCVVESVRPDEDAYARQAMERALQSLKDAATKLRERR